MLFIDSDIAFEPEAVLDILKYDKDIVGCLCPRKDISINRLLWSSQNETKSIQNLRIYKYINI